MDASRSVAPSAVCRDTGRHDAGASQTPIVTSPLFFHRYELARYVDPTDPRRRLVRKAARRSGGGTPRRGYEDVFLYMVRQGSQTEVRLAVRLHRASQMTLKPPYREPNRVGRVLRLVLSVTSVMRDKLDAFVQL